VSSEKAPPSRSSFGQTVNARLPDALPALNSLLTANVARWNEGAQRNLGHTTEAIMGKPGASLFAEEDRRGGLRAWELTTAAEKGKATDENWLVSKRGVRFWASGATTALRDESGRDAPVRLVFEPKSSRIDQTEFVHSLLAHTSLESNSSINLVMISADGRTYSNRRRSTIRTVGFSRRETISAAACELIAHERCRNDWYFDSMALAADR